MGFLAADKQLYIPLSSMGLYLLEMNEEWNDFRLPLVKYGKLKRDEKK